MAATVGVDGPRCPNCGGDRWTVALVAAPAEGVDEPVAGLDLAPAKMARCSACGLSADLSKRVRFER